VTAPVLARTRRRNELSLGLLVVAVTVGGYVLVALADGPQLPPDLYPLLAWVFGLYLIAHLSVRRFASSADPTLLPLAAMLNGIGFVMIARLADTRDAYAEQARVQSAWVAIAIGAFVVVLFVIRDVRVFERYRYICLLTGLLFLMLPMFPVIGRTINGARLWVAIGPLSFQPSEIAKILLCAFVAAYLVDKRELLTEGRVRIGRMFFPSPRDLGPLLLAWGVALMVLAYQKDMGTSVLFFGMFAAMLYIATRRLAYVIGALILLVVGAYIAYKAFGHVRVRVENWTNPWADPSGTGFQPIQGWLSLGSGGIAGTGLGLGNPQLVPNATTDYVFSAIGEELGLVGSIGIVSAFMLLVGSMYRIAVDAVRPFSQLFAAGIATIVGLQSFLIIGGVLRVIPLTGITLPFVSYGGSSLVANFALIAILLRISDDTARARTAP
jgi:cell division protein FtsW (lipid II flippase)